MQLQDHNPATSAWRWLRSILVLIAVALTLTRNAAVTHAQSFDSGSNGSDGALDFSSEPSGTTSIFDPRELGLDPDGDNVYHFTTITIPDGITVKLLGSRLNMRPVFWLASGAVVINGVLDLSGQNGHPASNLAGARFPSEPGPGGYPGGVGSRGNSPAQPGSGPGGGGAGGSDPSIASTGGGAGYAEPGDNGVGTGGGSGGPAYGNLFLVPLLGGSGGGGSYTPTSSTGGVGGGAGGGAILIASSESISLNGSKRINASGGGGAGGGSGGAVHLKAPVIIASANSPSQAPIRALSLSSGSPGRVRLEAFDFRINIRDFIAVPVATFASLSPVILPNNPPSIRVTSVAGVAVPLNPTGDFVMPDVPINSNEPVTVMIEAHNIPPGTMADFYVASEDGDDQIVSAELVGTMALSEATMNVTFPINLSRAFVRADYTP